MAFNLGVSSNGRTRLGGLSSIGVYLYEDIYYRQWISEIALAFYEGRQDEFVWLDLVRQFRNPEKQQILPINLTKEIVDETSILYREEPIYQVVDDKGKILKKDQELFDKIQKDSRYHTFMDKLDRWTRLLGTVLVKVSFIDPATGSMVDESKGGQIQLDMLHGGVYDIRHAASPHYVTELIIGFNKGFTGFSTSGHSNAQYSVSDPAGHLAGASGQVFGGQDRVGSSSKLGKTNRIYWGVDSHKQEDEMGKVYEGKNPYGLIPAVPFFNQDPAHYYFLPINEPLIYANHALNMRMTDLNHIAKFQSFGVPVIKGVERPTSIRQGRPVDDYNILQGGSAQNSFGGLAGSGAGGVSGSFRSFDAGLGISRDGNADANALGMSIGPDTAVAVGEKGDFKFAHPQADISGLVGVIQSIADFIRISHGLKAKHDQTLPDSGFALMIQKMGVIEDNIRRGKLFKEREQQLFQVIKRLWNIHHSESGEKKFSEKSTLEISYQAPKFPTDPKTQKEDIILENQILDTGDRSSYKKLYPHLSDSDINKMIKQRRHDAIEQMEADTQLEIVSRAMMEDVFGTEEEAGIAGGDSAGGAGGAGSSGGGRGTGKKNKYLGKSGGPGNASYDYVDDYGKTHTTTTHYEGKSDNKMKHSIGSSKQGANKKK